MKRSSTVIPGYDHVRNPCGKTCIHGIHGDEWLFAVADGDLALVLRVYSGVYPPSVPFRVADPAYPMGVDLDLHSATPTGDSVRDPGDGSPCEWVEGGRCWSGGRASVSTADALFKEHGARTIEQPESFWLEMERRLREARAAPQFRQCSHCAGKGIVPKEAPP
jgi:hypothetical protein